MNPQKYFKGKLSVNATDDGGKNNKLNENNFNSHSHEQGYNKNQIHSNFSINSNNKHPLNEFGLKGESQTKKHNNNLQNNQITNLNFSNFNFVNSVDDNYNILGDDCNYIDKFKKSNMVNLNISKNLHKHNNLIFDKILFERKKEEITPYKIIINDYVLKEEYEVDNIL